MHQNIPYEDARYYYLVMLVSHVSPVNVDSAPPITVVLD